VQKSEAAPAVIAEKPVETAPTEEINKAKKEDDEDEDDDKDDKDPKKKKKDDKKDDKKPAFMKKSEESEIGDLSDEEKDLIKAWRASANQPTEEIAKAEPKSEDKTEELKKALEAEKTEKEALKKAITDQSDLIKGLTDKVEKMASQPAYDKRSVSTLETIEKSEDEKTQNVTKPQILDALLELQKAGKATSFDVSKYESTNQLSKSLQESVKQYITNKVQ